MTDTAPTPYATAADDLRRIADEIDGPNGYRHESGIPGYLRNAAQLLDNAGTTPFGPPRDEKIASAIDTIGGGDLVWWHNCAQDTAMQWTKEQERSRALELRCSDLEQQLARARANADEAILAHQEAAADRDEARILLARAEQRLTGMSRIADQAERTGEKRAHRLASGDLDQAVRLMRSLADTIEHHADVHRTAATE